MIVFIKQFNLYFYHISHSQGIRLGNLHHCRLIIGVRLGNGYAVLLYPFRKYLFKILQSRVIVGITFINLCSLIEHSPVCAPIAVIPHLCHEVFRGIYVQILPVFTHKLACYVEKCKSGHSDLIIFIYI